MVGSRETEIGGNGRYFPPTSVSLLRILRESGADAYDEALGRLIALYWKPVYWLIRRLWGRTSEDAKDLTQGFFSEIVAHGTPSQRYDPRRGSFRAYLKGAVVNYVRDIAKSSGRQKRGGGTKHLSLRFDGVESERIEPMDPGDSPERAFDRDWRDQVLARAKDLLERRLRNAGKGSYFEAFIQYDLQPSNAQVTYQSVAESLGVPPHTVKFWVTRCRKEFRRAVEDIVSEYAGTRDRVDAEMRAILDL
jgi:RNA polymerase sigma factor (sigma-70 family)